MRHLLWVGLSTLFCASPVQADCVQPESLVRTTVRIATDIYREENGELVTYEIHGSAWFLSPTHLVTATHVARAMDVTNTWRPVTLTRATWRDAPEYTNIVSVRLTGMVYARTPESLTVLELQAPFPGTEVARVRETALVRDEPLVGVGYPHRELTFVTGTYLESLDYTNDGTTVYREYRIALADKESNPHAFGEGASGSPIFDCEGNVVFTISHLLPWVSFRICSRETGVCTETVPLSTSQRGIATNLAVPSKGLSDLLQLFTGNWVP